MFKMELYCMKDVSVGNFGLLGLITSNRSNKSDRILIILPFSFKILTIKLFLREFGQEILLYLNNFNLTAYKIMTERTL